MSLEILLQMEIWTWKKLAGVGWGGVGWGGVGVNDETEDVLVIDGEGGDEDDDATAIFHFLTVTAIHFYMDLVMKNGHFE